MGTPRQDGEFPHEISADNNLFCGRIDILNEKKWCYMSQFKMGSHLINLKKKH